MVCTLSQLLPIVKRFLLVFFEATFFEKLFVFFRVQFTAGSLQFASSLNLLRSEGGLGPPGF